MAAEKQPFFVAGSGRTGSTFLFNLLADHPQVALTNEGRVADFLFFCNEYAGIPQKTPKDFALHTDVTLHGLIRKPCIPSFSPIFLRHAKQMLEEFYDEHFKDKDFTHWGDKLPWPRTTLGLQDLYPHAKFIVLMRDPRAISASLLAFRERDLPAAPLLQQQNPDIWARYWVNSYSGLLQYLKNYIIVRYEDVVLRPLEQITRTLDYLGLEGAEHLLERANRRDTFKGHATSDSPTASLQRWNKALSEDDVQTIEKTCGGLMQEHGYELSG